MQDAATVRVREVSRVTWHEEIGAAWRAHWPEYLMEAGALGTFMVSACLFSVLLDHPASPVHQAIGNPLLRRFLGGLAMGLTLLGIVYSPWGKRSGAHMNPAFTLTFLRLGKVSRWDAAFYALSQFAGGLSGVMLAAMVIAAVRDKAINYASTVPGPDGTGVAFIAEFLISFGLMMTVLISSNTPRLSRYTPLLSAVLLTFYITVEAPLSGMSMNPARTFGSAWPANTWTAIWIYFAAPTAAMLAAGEIYRRIWGAHRIFCAKLHHHNDKRCIFRCNYALIRPGS